MRGEECVKRDIPGLMTWLYTALNLRAMYLSGVIKMILRKKIKDALKKLLKSKYGENIDLRIGHPKDEFGDYYTNIAFSLSKRLNAHPQKLAEEIAKLAEEVDEVERAEANRGFVNIFVKRRYITEFFKKAMEGADILPDIGNGRRVLIEFVSANPTGPLHVGHGRGAVIGDVLARTMERCGYRVEREFYINDAGQQITELLKSFDAFLKIAKGENIDVSQLSYQGDYLRKIAEEFLNNKVSYEDKRGWLIKRILDDIKSVLEKFGVFFDRWVSEMEFYKSGKVESVINLLTKYGYVEEKDGALWFKLEGLEQDKDRVLRRSNGTYTYFAGDIAYHFDKYSRNYDLIVNVWGADHHGYLPRLRGALKALGCDVDRLKIVWVQMVNILRGGKPVHMSKRKGEYITLREVIDEVGEDVARFFFLMRTTDTPLDFDLALAKRESQDNPVFYIKYAYARIRSVFEELKKRNLSFRDSYLMDSFLEDEYTIMRKVTKFPEIVEDVIETGEPHLLVSYILELVTLFHQYYTRVRFLVDDEMERSHRLSIIKGVQNIIDSALALMGIKPPEGRM